MSFQDFFIKFFRQLKVQKQVEGVNVFLTIGNFTIPYGTYLNFSTYVIYELSSIATIGNFVALTFKYVAGYNVPLNFYEPSLGLYYMLPDDNIVWGLNAVHGFGLLVSFSNPYSGTYDGFVYPLLIASNSPFYIYPFFTVFGTLVDMFPTNYTVL